ncbi:MAG: hypothetical protein LBP59_19970 [Planctomycetaceae bacterium]|jgi:hypothetical protein|nr:hypothetical protein [Planctomycetaceae bacterium]
MATYANEPLFDELSWEDTETLLLEISKSINNRSKNLNPIRVNYKIQTISKIETNFICEIARKGDKLRIFYNVPDVFNDTIINLPKDHLRVFDGKRAIIFDGKNYLDWEDRPFYRISVDQKNIVPPATIDSICGDEIIRNIIGYILKGNSGFKVNIVTKHEENNKNFLQINIQDKQARLVMRAKLIPEYGYGVDYLEVFDEKAKLVSIINNVQYKLVDDIFFPFLAENINYSNGRVTRKCSLTVTSVTCTEREIPDSLFKVRIPQNAVIEDMDTGQTLVHLSEVQAYLDALGQYRFPTRFFFISCINLIGIVILLFFNRESLKKYYKKISRQK